MGKMFIITEGGWYGNCWWEEEEVVVVVDLYVYE